MDAFDIIASLLPAAHYSLPLFDDDLPSRQQTLADDAGDLGLVDRSNILVPVLHGSRMLEENEAVLVEKSSLGLGRGLELARVTHLDRGIWVFVFWRGRQV